MRAGKIPGPCPDAAKAAPAIAQATARFEAAIAKACCGKNTTCALGDSGADRDVEPVAEVGFPPTCDAGGSACEATITGMESLIACFTCATRHDVECVTAASLPMLVVPYPAECD